MPSTMPSRPKLPATCNRKMGAAQPTETTAYEMPKPRTDQASRLLGPRPGLKNGILSWRPVSRASP